MKRRLLIVLALLGIVASGCTLGPRETWAEQMRDASKTAARIGSSKVHVDVSMKVIQTTIRVVPTPVFTSLDGVVDYKNRHDKLVAKSASTPKGATVFYDDLVTYLPRSQSAIGDHDSSKHWARYDFRNKPKPDTIDVTDHLASLGYALPPSLAVEMLDGILAGSVKRVGTSEMNGESVTQYEAKLAPDAVTRDLRSQGRLDGITRLFKILGQAQDTFRVDVWMDSKGLARRIQLHLRQEEDVVDQFRTTLDYTFTDYAPPMSMTLPERKDCLGHRRFVDFVNEYTRASV